MCASCIQIKTWAILGKKAIWKRSGIVKTLFLKILYSTVHWKTTTDPSLASGCDSEKKAWACKWRGRDWLVTREYAVSTPELEPWKGRLSASKASWAPPGGQKEVPASAHVEGRSALGSTSWPSSRSAHWPELSARRFTKEEKKSAKFFVRDKIIGRSRTSSRHPKTLPVYSLRHSSAESITALG